MRKLLLFFVTLLCAYVSKAQMNEAEANIALQLASSNRAAIGLTAQDLNNLTVASSYIDKSAGGIRMAYMQQTFKGLPVYNQTKVLAFRGGVVISNQGSLINMDKLAEGKSEFPSLSPEAAIQAALADRGLVAALPASLIKSSDNGHKLEFSNMGIASENITVELMWVPTLDGKSVNLGWQVYFMPKNSSDIWGVRIDASNGKTLGVLNYTVYCNWDNPNHKFMPKHVHPGTEKETVTSDLFDFKSVKEESGSIINGATYRVIPFPAESPIHPGGAHATRTDPWTAAPGNATTQKWHSDGTNDYTYSRGNNVWAYHDRNNNNAGDPSRSAQSTTPDPLTFNFTPDFTVAPTQTTPIQNQQFNITNLFYWNNIIHDVMYQYGFDEPNRNFQDNNMGRGGNGNDHVNAEAQDGSGTNNANFGTPADGGSGRMQMYLWTLTNPQRDGDVDNGIIVHEFGHGISNRLTGTTASCLGNAEQMGEGWSDYYSLMFTQDWAASTLNTGFNSPRGIGTYALGQPITGVGIRSQRYCTDFTVNNKVYAASIPAAPHDRGEIWCATLWDMTWNIINQVGTINPNIYNVAGGGGNTIALKLVTEGLKLQQCNPGFISGRNAILAADQALYAGAYSCAIREAFRRRGMGANASEGSTASVTDQIPDFTLGGALTLTQGGMTQVPEGQNIVYTNTVNAQCATLTNYTLTDTLPTNVTFVSATNGGTYNAGNRVVSWTVNQAPGTIQTYQFTVNVNPGSYFPPTNLLDEQVTGASIPATWTATTTVPAGGTLWTVVNTQSHSAPNSFFGVDQTVASDMRLATTSGIAMGATPPAFSFWHRYNTEEGWDGGVVEISTNGGANWTDLGANMTQNGYNSSMGTGSNNPLGGRAAFSGASGSFIQTKVNLAAYANQTAMFRFRAASDDNTAPAGGGWWVDDILLRSVAVVNMRSSLFNASNVRTNLSDTVTEILPPVGGCVGPAFTAHPSNTSVCPTATASFTVTVTGTAPVTYQWQENTGSGFVNITNGGIYSGATTATLTLTGVTAGMNNYQYRVIATGCSPAINVNSNPATLTVIATSVGGTVNPATTNVCGAINSGTLTLTGHTGAVIRWESATNPGGPWTPIANTTTTYTFTNITQTMYYRAVVQANGCAAVNSSTATVNFTASSTLLIVADPGTTICQGNPARLTVYEQGAPTSVTVTQSSSNAITALNSVSCNAAGLHTDNSYWRAMNLAPLGLTGALTISNVSFAIEQANAAGTGTTQPVTVRLYTQTGAAFPGGTRTQIATQTFAVPDQAATIFTGALGTPVTVAPTDIIVMEVFTPSGQAAGHSFFIGSNTAAQTGPSYISAASCGIANPTDLAAIGFPNMHVVMSFSGTVPGVGGIVTGGTFLWTPAAGLSSTTTNPVAASPNTTTTYTVNHDNGAGCVRQASITINVLPRPNVTVPPSGTTVCAGQPATFTATAVGDGAVLQWQQSTDNGGTWTNLTNTAPYSGVNTPTLTINPTTVAMNGYRFRLSVSGTCSPVFNSTSATLNVNPLPVVTIAPAGPVCGGVAGINGTLLTASSATGTNFIWTPATGLYTNATATTPYVAGTPTATVYAAPTTNTTYTVSATNGSTGCVGSASVVVNYTPPAPIVTPASATICLGGIQQLQITSSLAPVTATFSSGAINVAVPDNTPNGVTSTINVTGIPVGATVSSISVALNMSHSYPGDMIFNLKSPASAKVLNLYKYNGGNATGPVSLTPASGWYNAQINNTSTTAFSAVGNPYSYGVTAPTGPFRADALNTPVTPLGFPFDNPVGFVSDAANFSEIWGTPATPANGTWTLAMADGGPGDLGTLTGWSITLTYGVPSTGIWSPTAGLYTDAAATVPYTGAPAQTVYASPTTIGVNNYTVTVANGSCTSPSRTVPVTVNQPVAITAQPVNVTVCTDKVATFSVTATGTTPGYQWQVSTDNGNTWSPITNGGVYAGATTATLTITAPPTTMNGYLYRVVVVGAAPCGNITSAQRLLTVNPLPNVVIAAAPYTKLFPGLVTTLTSTVTPTGVASYVWRRNGVVVPGATGATLNVDVDGLGLYSLFVTDVNGCTNTSNSVLISDSVTGRVFIYPNPNTGRFQVRYYSVNANTLVRGLTIYDAKGSRVLVQQNTITAPYARMDVDMSKFGKGIYWVELGDLNGNRLAVGRVIIQ